MPTQAAVPPSVAADGADVVREAARRRTFAVISHPDAGKSTLTEALALHARVITEAGHVNGKAGRRSTVSDWMDIEKSRGISISSAALQFRYRDHVLNLVDTPGHADFSEDTYRVLAGVDAAVMLLDAAKGLEPQTLKLFQVCRHRGIPVITVVNKWDRPGRSALELMDEIEHRIGIRPTPLTWPVGIAGEFAGVLDRRTGRMVRFTRTPGGATIAPETDLAAADAAREHGADWQAAADESDLLAATGADFDAESFLAGRTTPVLFAAAVLNFGVRHVLDALVDVAPPPRDRADVHGRARDVAAPFSALVFKVQAGMDAQHRDRLAFARVCSGRFERGMVVTHAATGRPFATKYVQQVFGRGRSTVDVAYPGDVIGLVNAALLRPGDTLYADAPVEFPPIPSFAPEHFAVCRAVDSGRYKQFRRGVEQLEQEGVVQVLRSDLRGAQAPVLAAVGPMQFEVASHRMANEFGASVTLESLAYRVARRTDRDSAPVLARVRGVEVMERTADGALLALFPSDWAVMWVRRDHPGLVLDPLVAAADDPAEG